MPRPANTPAVLWSKVDRRGPNECWPWKAFKNAQGYGRVWMGYRGYYAHRVIYDLVYPGRIKLAAPKDRCGPGFLRHTCDNPQCCNPRHLKPGTQTDNMRDKVSRQRQSRLPGELHPRAKLTNEEAFWLRLQFRYGATRNALALLYGISLATVKVIVSGRHYR